MSASVSLRSGVGVKHPQRCLRRHRREASGIEWGSCCSEMDGVLTYGPDAAIQGSLEVFETTRGETHVSGQGAPSGLDAHATRLHGNTLPMHMRRAQPCTAAQRPHALSVSRHSRMDRQRMRACGCDALTAVDGRAVVPSRATGQ